MVERSGKPWTTGEVNGKPLQYSCLENPVNSLKREKDRTLKDELLRSVGAPYTTGDWYRNNFRKNEETETKEKQRPVVDVTGDGSKGISELKWTGMGEFNSDDHCIDYYEQEILRRNEVAIIVNKRI